MDTFDENDKKNIFALLAHFILTVIMPMKFEEIESYYLEALLNAENKLNWYPGKRRKFRFFSQAIRFGTIILVGIGGIMPLIELAFSNQFEFEFVKFGYISFSLAASLFLLDKYFGYSTGWMRFMLSEVELNKLISKKQSDWLFFKLRLHGKVLTEENVKEILQFISKFTEEVNNIIIAETKEWINEFKTTNLSLEKLTSGNTNSSVKPPSVVTETEGDV